jgi:predicted porin
MQKKLIAAAVAGALFAPALASAQTSTVQIYGRATFEYGFADQVGRPDSDFGSSPGGAAIGFKGEEKLGGNLSAWFQCESSADTFGQDQRGLCSRNSAVGLKGGFGNVYFGRWDTPFKRAMGQGTVGAEETGLLGMSFLPFGGSGGANATGGAEAHSGENANRTRWKRREAGGLWYDSPNFGGFQVLAGFTTGNGAADAVDGDANEKPRVISIAGTYTAGPLAVGLGYERHNDFGRYLGGAATPSTGTPASCAISPTATGALVVGTNVTCTAATASAVPTISLDDHAWGISAAYTFGGVAKVGFTYMKADYETGPGQSMDKKTWTIGVDWNIAGPHSLHAQYAGADDTGGNSTTTLAANGGVTRPCSALVAGVCTPTAGGTGGDAWSIAYQYAFSKRTTVRFGYVKVDNDGGTTSYRLGEIGSLTGASANGSNTDTFAAIIKHSF